MDNETRQQIDALWAQFDRMWEYLGYSKEAMDGYRRVDHLGAQVEAYKREIAEQFRNDYENAARYLNVIVAIGYAGYFAAWTFTRDLLTDFQIAVVGTAGLISVAFFSIWEITSMVLRFINSWTLRSLMARQHTPDEFFAHLKDVQLRDANRKALLLWVWIVLFALAVLAALIGGAVLVWALVGSLWK